MSMFDFMEIPVQEKKKKERGMVKPKETGRKEEEIYFFYKVVNSGYCHHQQ